MRILTLFTALAAIVLTVNALPVSTPFPFFTLNGLPGCAKTCKSILNADIYCLPPTAPVSNEATYTSCFCQSQWLHGVKDNTGICPQECGEKDEKEIQNAYNDLCGIPGPSATRFLSVPAPTSAPTSTSAPSTSISIPLTTSTLTPAPIRTPAPPAAEPQDQPDEHETSYVHTDPSADVLPLTSIRAHTHLVIILMPILGVLIGLVVWLLFVRWYTTTKGIGHWYGTRKIRIRVRERDPSHVELLLAKHQKYFDRCQRRNPILIVDNGRRARLWRWLKREKIHPAEGQEVHELQETNKNLQRTFGIKYKPKDNKFVVDRGSRISRITNRRPRFTHDAWIRANESAPLSRTRTPRSVRADRTPERPFSARTEASSVGPHSAYSPLDTPRRTIAPQLPARPGTPQTSRTPQSPHSPAILPPTVYRPTTPTVRSAIFARVPNSSRVSDGWRSFSSPRSPTSPCVDMAPLLPARSFGGGSQGSDSMSFGDEIAEGSIRPTAGWETPRLRERR
jgi:hypothetical protein